MNIKEIKELLRKQWKNLLTNIYFDAIKRRDMIDLTPLTIHNWEVITSMTAARFFTSDCRFRSAFSN